MSLSCFLQPQLSEHTCQFMGWPGGVPIEQQQAWLTLLDEAAQIRVFYGAYISTHSLPLKPSENRRLWSIFSCSKRGTTKVKAVPASEV